jgi:hypothetical protein
MEAETMRRSTLAKRLVVIQLELDKIAMDIGASHRALIKLNIVIEDKQSLRTLVTRALHACESQRGKLQAELRKLEGGRRG